MTDTPDSLRRSIAVVERRIDRALDGGNRHMFALHCQHRAQLLHRLAAAEDEIDRQAQPAL